MQFIFYLLLTAIAYVICLVKLKGRTEQERIGSTPVFFNTLIFFGIFEFYFLKSLFSNPGFHLFGIVISLTLSLSVYFYLKSLKKDVESIFYKLINQGEGKVSILTFMQRTELSQEEATAFLEQKIAQHQGDSYETLGNIYYEFYNW